MKNSAHIGFMVVILLVLGCGGSGPGEGVSADSGDTGIETSLEALLESDSGIVKGAPGEEHAIQRVDPGEEYDGGILKKAPDSTLDHEMIIDPEAKGEIEHLHKHLPDSLLELLEEEKDRK